MFSKTVLVFFALAATVSAAATNVTARADAVVQCATGNAPMCCNTFNDLTSASGSNALGNLGGFLQGTNGQGGVQCVAVGVQGGALSSDCKNANACCGQTGQAGFASFSCTPVNII
ncbi:hypothetical protein EXIGLDRAFT_763699 [Exidia glandulosa HHB12029]|uniref:Hydrophobin n=1 Tax=Exidia glandulosa HHB12029 TaxID=1314781 RepID=A0A165LR77_EXIGL|nr:hypothetical protein EXIGLDRAFT_763699 [Exidia glandulosa HHB12029]